MRIDEYYQTKEVPMQTYGDVESRSQLEQFDIYHREKLEYAISILEPVLTPEMRDVLFRKIDRECELRERRRRNLQQAQRAMDELCEKIGFQESMNYDFDSGRIIRTPMGEFWIALRGLLEEFWTS